MGKKLLTILGAALLLFVLGGAFVFLLYAKELPRPEKFTERQLVQSTKIYDRSGEVLLYEIYGEEKRTPVPLKNIPSHLQEAVIATEDNNFYNHSGIDIEGILRAVWKNIKIGELVYGGSTIPQQLIRSTFFTTQKTLERKFREAVLALELDRRYSKKQILGWYLNQVPFGSNCYGVEAASQTYFNKPVSEISLEESAVLAALIRAPSYYSPYGLHKKELSERKNYVLERMEAEGYIGPETLTKTKNKKIEFSKSPIEIKAPYFTLWAKEKLTEKYGEEYLKRNGLKVYTTLDWELQKTAEEETRKGVIANRKNHNAYNAGLVALNPANGEVLAVTVGTGEYYTESIPEGCVPGKNCLFDPQFNVVAGPKKYAGRQPGSAFKPFVYATAFKKGATATTTVIDEKTSFGVWGDKEYVPKNYDGRFRGRVTLRQALAQSLNVPSVKVLVNLCGKTPEKSIKAAVKTAENLGISTLEPPFGPSIVLGGWEVKLLDMVSAYGVFATEGQKVPPVIINKIENQRGQIIEKNNKTPKRVLSKEIAKLITDILSDNEARTPMFGPNSPLHFENYKVAAKTGTTQEYKDAWTIGYTPSIAAGVWVGNNDGALMRKAPGSVVAGPIFHNFLEKALSKKTN